MEDNKILLEMQRRQDEMYRQIMELQQANSRLMALMQSNIQSSSMYTPSPPGYPKAYCSHFFRVFQLGASQFELQVLTPIFYVNHLGFKGWYGYNGKYTSDQRQIGICLAHFGSNGPEQVQVRVKVSLIDSFKKHEDWVLLEYTGTIDSTNKGSMSTWSSGLWENVHKKDMYKRRFLEPPNPIVRYDVSLL